MKKIYFIFPFITAVLCLSGCIGKFEEYNRNPYQPSSVPVNNLLSSMFNVYASPQQNECQFNNCMWACYSGQITAPHNWQKGTGIFAYFNPPEAWNQSTTNTFFTKIYSNYFVINRLTNGTGTIFNIAQLTRIYAMQEVASLQGPIPYTKIKEGEIYVEYDDEPTVWNAMFKDLDDVIKNLKLIAANGIDDELREVDQIYNGDCSLWLKFANTLKLRMAIRISGISPELAKEKAEEAVADGVMTSTSDSAYDNNNSGQTNNGFKIIDGWGELRANACLVSYMNGYEDPRRAAYFTKATNGDYVGVRSGTKNPPTPATYKDYSSFKICRVANKGLLDAGENPMPIMYASEAAFLRAEGALKGWDMKGTAQSLYEEGIKLSFKEFEVEGVEDYINNSTRVPGDHKDPESDADSYVNKSTITIKWDDSATDAEKLERIITQKWIACLLNPLEGWADFRRTGYPRIFPPVVNASQDGCNLTRQMRRLHFPESEYNGNRDNTMKACTYLPGGKDSFNADLWWALKSNGSY